MRPAHRIAWLAVVAVGLPCSHADEPFRCGKWVVTSAMTLGELTSKCGEPASRTSRTEHVLVRNRNNGLMLKAGQTTIETLTWDRGPRAAAMVVTVVDGTIKSIERKP